jgi:hypothetical protein
LFIGDACVLSGRIYTSNECVFVEIEQRHSSSVAEFVWVQPIYTLLPHFSSFFMEIGGVSTYCDFIKEKTVKGFCTKDKRGKKNNRESKS